MKKECTMNELFSHFCSQHWHWLLLLLWVVKHHRWLLLLVLGKGRRGWIHGWHLSVIWRSHNRHWLLRVRGTWSDQRDFRVGDVVLQSVVKKLTWHQKQREKNVRKSDNNNLKQYTYSSLLSLRRSFFRHPTIAKTIPMAAMTAVNRKKKTNMTKKRFLHNNVFFSHLARRQNRVKGVTWHKSNQNKPSETKKK